MTDQADDARAVFVFGGEHLQYVAEHQLHQVSDAVDIISLRHDKQHLLVSQEPEPVAWRTFECNERFESLINFVHFGRNFIKLMDKWFICVWSDMFVYDAWNNVALVLELVVHGYHLVVDLPEPLLLDRNHFLYLVDGQHWDHAQPPKLECAQ